MSLLRCISHHPIPHPRASSRELVGSCRTFALSAPHPIFPDVTIFVIFSIFLLLVCGCDTGMSRSRNIFVPSRLARQDLAVVLDGQPGFILSLFLAGG